MLQELQTWLTDTFSQNPLDLVFLGATLYEWGVALIAWGVLSLVVTFVGRFFIRRFESIAGRLSKRTDNVVDDALVHTLKQTKTYTFVALALYLAFLLTGMPERVVGYAGRLATLILLLQVIVWGSAFIKYWTKDYQRRKLDTDPASVTSVQALSFIGRLVLWTVVFLTALATFDVDITAAVAGLGVGGIAVALAVQNILGDLFASLSIVLDKPFVVGDFLIVGELMGTVERVGLKTTRLRSLSGEQLVFSNSDLLNSRIRNYKRMQERRIVFTIGVTYDTRADVLERIPTILRECVESQEQTRFDRAHFSKYGDFSLNFETVYFVLVPDFGVYMDIQQAINLRLYRRFEEENISFAYPTQTLHVQPVKVEPVNGTSSTQPAS